MRDPVQTFWHEITKTEPYWSVLTNDKFKMENINLSEFYETGESFTKVLLKYLTDNNLITDIYIALDFGCGVGRMTAPLSKICNHIDALDLSSGMIEIADQYLKDNNLDNVTLVDTSLDPFLPKPHKYDLVFSSLVLQHNPPPRARDLLGQLCQSISKQGVGVISIFTRVEDPSDPRVSYAMQMHEFPLEDATEVINENNCELVEYNLDNLKKVTKKQDPAAPKPDYETGYLIIKVAE